MNRHYLARSRENDIHMCGALQKNVKDFSVAVIKNGWWWTDEIMHGL